MAPTRERHSAHNPGVVLRDLIVSIADGGDCVTDLCVLRDQGVLFGAVASERTAHRVIKSVDSEPLEAIRGLGTGPRMGLGRGHPSRADRLRHRRHAAGRCF